MIAGLLGAAIIACLAMPWARHPMERVMIVHMLVQIPLLAVAGALIARTLPARWRSALDAWNESGISGILMAVAASSWWMVPRALDSALATPAMELAKFVTLPLFVGVPLALSWPRLGGMGRGFVIANVLPMWAVVGWMYAAAPVRVCNYYLLDAQAMAGSGLLMATVALAALAGGAAFRGRPTITAS